MTDQTEAPERIWCQSDTKRHLADIEELAVKPVPEVLGAFTEYVRASALDRVKAEAEKRGMERAIEVISSIPGESEAIAAIRAEAEREKG